MPPRPTDPVALCDYEQALALAYDGPDALGALHGCVDHAVERAIIEEGFVVPSMPSNGGVHGSDYSEFLKSKQITAKQVGFKVDLSVLNPMLFDWQRDIVRWAIWRGTAAIFADCGLGKTPMQLEWARNVCAATNGSVLILAPLAVNEQTAREGEKFGIPVNVARSQEQVVANGINIANYEMLDHFDCALFAGVVLDESSILKSFMGKTKRKLVDAFENTRYRLCCTATPAPNDHLELGNHSQFLGIMDSDEMISRWFVNDSMAAGNYKLKGHGADDFWRWVASWAICLSHPSDLGYEDDGFILPALRIHHRIVQAPLRQSEGRLFHVPEMNATDLHKELRITAGIRAESVAELVNTSDEPWLIWCNSDYEADEINKRVPDAMEVRGTMDNSKKSDRLMGFISGRYRVLLTKPSIAGFGLNLQHCWNVAFIGLSYSYEQYYQALRRVWRFGQTRPVQCYIVGSDTEGPIVATIDRKERDHERMKAEMVSAMKDASMNELKLSPELVTEEERDTATGSQWKLMLGDCVTRSVEIPSDSVDFSIFSPPFSSLYIYSDSIADMGNSVDDAEFFQHFRYLLRELYRITKPGRNCSVHCKDLPLYKGRDGAAGLRDFPGQIIREFEAEHWTFHSRVTIWKDPVIEMQRTKNMGLLHRNFTDRSEVCRMGMADYVLTFRKWTEDLPDKQVTHAIVPGDYIGLNPPETWDSPRDYSIQTWQRYASPVWFDIRQTNVLQGRRAARAEGDEKHICPLQLDVIERCLWLWTNPGELVFSPFAGIGSEGYVALKQKRRFIGVELKRSYWETASKNLNWAETQEDAQGRLL